MYRLVLSVLLLLPALAQSEPSQITVRGRTTGAEQCQLKAGQNAEFEVTFNSFQGTKPVVHYGIQSEPARQIASVEKFPKQAAMRVLSDGSAVAQIVEPLSSRGNVKFVFRLSWQNTMGEKVETNRFSVELAASQCTGEWDELEIH